jgi:tripartite-type tricarboxylate transporter receptor subunit TctC
MRFIQVLALWSILCSGGALAQGYPAKSITMVVPFTAGGPTDTIARIMAERMGRSLGQTIIVENVTGAGGTIAVGRVVRAAPDGYTLTIGHLGSHVIAGAIYPIKYDQLKDLEPVAMIVNNPQILVSKTALAFKDLKELIAWTRANGDKVSIGTGGAGTPAHVSAVYFNQATGSNAQIIHYRGSAPAMTDLFAGVIDLYFDQTATAVANTNARRVNAYVLTAKSRIGAAPEIPTTDEAGLPGFYMSVWHAIWVPRATPKPVIARLNDAIVETLADLAVRKRLVTDMVQEIPPREQQTPEYLGAHHKAETDKWWPLIKAAGIKAE